MSNWQLLVRITFKRMRSQLGLTAATLAGLTVALTLVMIVPLYADAVNFRILQEQLSAQTGRNKRPPFAYLYNYIGAWNEPVNWAAIEPVTTYLRDEGAQTLGLPGELFVWHVETDNYNLSDGSLDLGRMRFATTSDLETQIDLIDGVLPTQATERENTPIEGMMMAARAAELGVAVGDSLVMRNPRVNGQDLLVKVTGLWQPIDAEADYWFYASESFDEVLSVPAATYSSRLATELDDEVYLAVWYWVLDGDRLGTSDVDRLLAGALEVEEEIGRILPETQSLQSPVGSLQTYRSAVSVLTRQLLGFNAPTMGLVIAFIGLVVSLAVQQRRNEMAVTRSRGGTARQLVSMAALEGFLLGVIAFVLALLLSMWLTGQMGRVRSFMDFSAETQLRTLPNRVTLLAGLGALAIVVLAQILPTVFASGDTIITYKRSQARRQRPPWWQRSFLDIVLIGLSAYGIYQLQNDGDIFGQAGVSVLENPILLLLPTLGILGVTLLFLRVLPLAMRLFSHLLSLTNSVTLLQASRYLSRSTGLYATPLVLLTLTVSLSVFTASLARTFDYQLFDQAHYRVGADMNVLTSSNSSAENRFIAQPVDVGNESLLPTQAYESIEGVRKAARVGRFPTNIEIEGQRTVVEFVGIERLDFAGVGFWRRDFSAYRAGSLMNALGRSPTSVLAPVQLLDELGLAVGDRVPVVVSVAGGRVAFSAEIAATFDYFPTWYPDSDDLILVGNLTTIFEQVGGEVPYRVWLDIEDDFDEEAFATALRNQQSGVSLWQEPRSEIEATLVQPQRQGVFGLLSVGFIASALLTVLGFFLYAVFSFRRRMIELSILRAIGLSSRRVKGFIAWELGLLIGFGLLLGTLLGVEVSRQFIPLLQTGTRQVDLVPPYLVEIAWPAISQIYVLFGLMFLLAFEALSRLLRRMKVFEAIKLGETV